METKTEAKTDSVFETKTEASEITTTKPAAMAQHQPLEWTQARIDLLRKQVCPPSASPEEFALFLEWCRMTGLNPFIQQAYLIPRRQKVGEKWVDKHMPLASIAGMRAKVDQQPDHLGIEGGPVYIGDKFGVNQLTGEVIHEWDLESRVARGWRVVGAWARAKRRGRSTKLVFLPFESRVQDGPFWKSDPSGQIAKCAEAAAYREAYPNALGGVFLQDEIGDSGAPMEVDVTPPAATSKTDALRSRVESAAKKAVESATKKTEAKAAAPAPAQELPIDQIRFGRFKGKLIADLSTLELEATLTEADALRPKVTGKWLQPFVDGVAAIQNEIALRERGGEVSAPGVAEPTKHANPRDGQTTAREPGSEG